MTRKELTETETDSHTQRIDLCQRGWAGGIAWEFEISRCKVLYIRMDKQLGPTI